MTSETPDVDTCTGCGMTSPRGTLRYPGGSTELLCPLCHHLRLVDELVHEHNQPEQE